MSAGIGSVPGHAASWEGWLPDMSRFSRNVVQPILGSGTTASALQLETLGQMVERFLLRSHPPARLKASEAAELLGFHEDDMAILVREALIAPLGEPTHNAVKYFALADVEALGRCQERLSAATKAIYGRNRWKSRDACTQSSACYRLIREVVISSN